jgi:mevalonate kinase
LEKRYYSNGKLLITGEYVVLNGATALAVPTRFGQELIVNDSTPEQISWTAYDADGTVWIDLTINYSDIFSHDSREESVLETLTKILHEAWKMNPDCFAAGTGYRVQTELSFPRQWGLGTSSTLIANIARWTETDPYQLLRVSFGGSGYDIACATHDTAILYRLLDGVPNVTPVDFNPSFSDKLYFVYLNRKQSSKKAISVYKNRPTAASIEIDTISKISERLYKADDILSFTSMLQTHEACLSNLLQTNTVGAETFTDFPGTVKSLGAWGGDFILAVSETDPTPYFNERGYYVVIPWKEMIL